MPEHEGSCLWSHFSPNGRVTGDPSSVALPLSLVLSCCSFPCSCILGTYLNICVLHSTVDKKHMHLYLPP